jgi:hypothetical protein
MRRLRITVVLAAVACVFGVVASPALAKKEKPKAFFGEFFANYPSGKPITPSEPAVATTKEGELESLYVAGENTGPFAFRCASLSSKSIIPWERSETFLAEIKFHKCEIGRHLTKGITEWSKAKVGNGFEMEFHSNGSATLGKTEGEAVIKKGTSFLVDAKGAQCKIEIPEQTVPTKAENHPEKEFEAAEYSTFEEPEPTKKFPSGFQDRLEIEWNLSHVTFQIPVAKESHCEYAKEPAGHYNPVTKAVEFKGVFAGDLEEIKIKKGDVGFSEEKV